MEARNSFIKLKKALINRPCLAPVNFDAPFIVTTDASETHYASCLSQKGSDGIERPCGYSSKLLSTKESKQQPGMRERAALLHALRHWQPYLIGREFVLRTDHNPNLALAKGKMKSYDTLTDEILQFMPFKMEFMNGNRMFVDALSRQTKTVCAVDLGGGPSCPVIFDEQVIRGHQTSDPDLQFHFMLHKQIIKSLPNNCQLKIGTHLYNDLICTYLKTGRRVIVAPKKLQSILIFLAHNNSGHLSSKYTYDRLAHNWIWQNMQSDIDNYCKSCHDCAQIKPPAHYIRLPLEKMSPTAREFGDRLHIDLLSMPTSAEGHVAIVTAVDAATGFVFAKACLDKTSKTVTNLLLDTIIPYFGCPKTIVTDLGVENKNQEVSQLFDYFKIQHITSSRAHPQSNGMVERRQRMLLNFARLYSDTYTNQNLWHLRLPMCQLLLNSTKSSSRNFSPFFLTFFRNARLPYSAILSRPLNLKEDSGVAAKLRMANNVLKLAMDNLAENFKKNQISHVPSRIPEIKEGSQLFVLTSQRNNVSYKLAKRWVGPYICIKLLNHNNVLLKPISGRKIIKVHKNLCKLVEYRKEHLRLDESNPFSSLTQTPNNLTDDSVIEPNTGPYNDPIIDDPLPPAPQDPPQPPSPPPNPSTDPSSEESADSSDPDDVSEHSFHSPPSSPHLPPAAATPPPSPPGRLTRARAGAEGISLPQPSYQEHTIEFNVGKTEREKKKLPQAEATPSASTSSGSLPPDKSVKPKSKLDTATNLAQLERDKKREADTHKQSMAAIRKATMERIKKAKEAAQKK